MHKLHHSSALYAAASSQLTRSCFCYILLYLFSDASIENAQTLQIQNLKL